MGGWVAMKCMELRIMVGIKIEEPKKCVHKEGVDTLTLIHR